MTVDSCTGPQILTPERRETDAKAPRLGKNATPFHSPTTAEPQRTSIANNIIKHAKPLSFRNSLNYDVEGRRFMGAWKN